MPLRDVLVPRPRVLFVGINPSLRSAEVGHHFAGPGNPFWRLLAAAGLVPEGFGFAADRGLPALGLGLTNIVPRATRAAAELTAVLRTRRGVRLGPEAGAHRSGAGLRRAQPERAECRLSRLCRQARVVSP